MRYLQYLVLACLLLVPVNSFAGPPLTQSWVSVVRNDRPDEDVYTYYDLRERKTYIQLTNEDGGDDVEDSENPLCIHIQIFQQDKGCTELNFEDELTPNDTVIYDMDNLLRNDGSEVPINLDDDSYGIVLISSFACDNRNDDSNNNPLLGNVRIIDDAGYEYRMNLFTDRNGRDLSEPVPTGDGPLGRIVVPFNTVDGAKYADVIAFITEDNRLNNGQLGDVDNYNIYNEEVGITFDVFQFDENEEPLSCDRKTFGCGPNVVLNYGINEDYPASRGDNLLCEGAGLVPGQTNGYISLENVSFLSPIDNVDDPPEDDFEFVCMVGLNNGDNTGSMDSCVFVCDDDATSDRCNDS